MQTTRRDLLKGVGAMAVGGELLGTPAVLRAQARKGVPAAPVKIGILAIQLGIALFTVWRVERLTTDWPQVVAARNANMRALLDRDVGRAVQRGWFSAGSAAQIAGNTNDTVALFRRLGALRERSRSESTSTRRSDDC